MHSYYPQGYNRNIVYPLIGFDKFLHMNNMKDVKYIREYPDDLSTYKNIIDIYENKEPGKKMFNFTLTMQNHGSYTDSNFENTIIAEDGQYPKLNQYLSLIKIADESFKYLIDYFSKQEEPTIIVMFGDHQPYVEDEFYQELLSQSFDDINSKEATERKYITPYIIWANYDIDEEKYKDVTDISANYLASLLLDVANIQKTPYLQFLDELKTEIPIITGNGYMDKTGIYHDFSETNKYTKLIENYHFIQFNNMFDNSNKLTSLFTVPEQARR
jgi:phosphoglycerol transferase MdoB-like AlkP superfamily enzyme